MIQALDFIVRGCGFVRRRRSSHQLPPSGFLHSRRGFECNACTCRLPPAHNINRKYTEIEVYLVFFTSLPYLFPDSDEDDSYLPGEVAEPILEPKDPYSLRPLPIRIGTPAFLQEDDIGLGEYASDSEGGQDKDNTSIYN